MLTETQKQELIPLYAKLAALTRSECSSCPGLCCNWYYCYLAVRYAADEWGTRVEVPPHPHGSSLAGDTGCPLPPHLRPVCTMHHCYLRQEGQSPWRVEYDVLLDRIAHVHFGRAGMGPQLWGHFFKLEGQWALDEARELGYVG